MSSDCGFSARGSHRHVAQFYDDDGELAGDVAGDLAGAIAEGGTAVIVATPARRAGFEARLAADGVDIAAARHRGALTGLDAAWLVRRLTREDRIDRPAFDACLRPAIQAAAQAAGPVRVYGEAVALLWAVGQVNAALELEDLWNGLGREMPFSLYCGYPRQLVESTRHPGPGGEVCRQHTSLIGYPPAGRADLMIAAGPAAGAPGANATRAFAGTLDEPRAARRFVLGMLAPWRGEQLFMDSALVVTELATNAVRHAGSAFRVSLVLRGGRSGSAWMTVFRSARPGGTRDCLPGPATGWAWSRPWRPAGAPRGAPAGRPSGLSCPCVANKVASWSGRAGARTGFSWAAVTMCAGSALAAARPGQPGSRAASRLTRPDASCAERRCGQEAAASVRSSARVSRWLRPGSSPTPKMMGHSSVTPASASPPSCFSIPASVPVTARPPGDATPSRFSSLA